MQDKKSIAFTTTVTERDWESGLSGWRCPALKIPGAKVESVFVSGNRADSSWYEVNYEIHVIRWVHSEPPLQATFLIKLTEELSTKDLTLRWKKIAIILPILSSIIVALVAGIFSYLSQKKQVPITDQPPVIISSACPDGVKITAPANMTPVNMSLVVNGTYQNLLPGQQIWIVVYPLEVGKFYPQNAVTFQNNHTWFSQAYIGLTQDKGKDFRILAVVADKQAQDLLNYHVKLSTGQKDYSGMVHLPDTALVCDSITVTRK